MNMDRIFRFYNSLIRSSPTTVPYISTYMLYLCRHKLKTNDYVARSYYLSMSCS